MARIRSQKRLAALALTAALALAPQPARASQPHWVAPGETLHAIAGKYHTSTARLARLNPFPRV